MALVKDTPWAARLREATAIDARVVLHVLLLAGVCILPVLLYLPFLKEPFLRDEGFYAAVAQRVLDGGIPYRDAFDNKPPLVYGWFSLSFLLFGESVWAPRLLVSVLLGATTMLVYIEGRFLYSRNMALLAALAFALSMGIAKFQTNANTEYFLLLPMTGAMVAFTLARRSDSWSWYAAAGALGGLAVMTKQVAVFNLLGLALVPLWWAVRTEGWQALRRSSAWAPTFVQAGGCLLAVAVVCAPFITTGSFGALTDQVVFYAMEYSAEMTLAGRLRGLAEAPLLALFVAGPWVLMAVLGTIHAFRRGDERSLLVVAWLGASLLGVAAAGRFYGHYLVQLLPAAALLLPFGLMFIVRKDRTLVQRSTFFAVFAVLAVLAIMVAGTMYLRSGYEERHLAKYPDAGLAQWENESDELAAWLAERTHPDDHIYNLGFQSEIYFYADRRSPTRFLFDHPFAVSTDYEREALTELQANPPRYVVDSAIYEPKLRALNYYPELIAGWVHENYTYIGRVLYADIYEYSVSITTPPAR